jgi:hypothetical protein
MTTFRFFTNLRPETVAAFERSGYAPPAWLLSSHRLTRETERLAAWVRASGTPLFADNGTHPLIGRVAALYEDTCAPLAADIRALRRGLPDNRRIPLAREVPDALTERARALVESVTGEVDRMHASRSSAALLDDQLRMRPTHLVAREDYATACALALGLEREITRLPVSWFLRRNRITFDYWEQAAADPRCRDIDVYATLGAVDYNTARAAARAAARRGITRVALGCAGINNDGTFADRYLAGAGRALPGPAPRRYVRLTEVACGIRDGYREAGVRLRAFHALGLGAATQFPTLAAAFDWHTHISVDATSPLHDSVQDRVFYDGDGWGERIHVTGAARRVLDGGDWSFACPFCDYLRARFGHDPDGARAWWAAEGGRPIDVADLDPGRPLGACLPTFATAAGSSTSVQTRARTAHNHWVIDGLCAQVPSRDRAAWGRAQLDSLRAGRTRATRMGLDASRAILDALTPLEAG